MRGSTWCSRTSPLTEIRTPTVELIQSSPKEVERPGAMLLLRGSRLKGPIRARTGERYDALCGLPTRLPGTSTGGPVALAAASADDDTAAPALSASVAGFSGFAGLSPGPLPFDVADWFSLLRPPRFGGASGLPFAWPLSAPVWLPLSVPVLLPTPAG